MKQDRRRAFVCAHKDHEGLVRVFLFPGEKAPPKCGKGHTMTPQPNRKYNAKGKAK
jgi:hypothetical protein